MRNTYSVMCFQTNIIIDYCYIIQYNTVESINTKQSRQINGVNKLKEKAGHVVCEMSIDSHN